MNIFIKYFKHFKPTIPLFRMTTMQETGKSNKFEKQAST